MGNAEYMGDANIIGKDWRQMVDFGNSTHCRNWFFKGEDAAEEHLKAIGEQKLQKFRS